MVNKKSLKPTEKSTGDENNPCPFLRAFANEGVIDSDCEPMWSLASKVTSVMDNGVDKPSPKLMIAIIASLASARSISSFFRALTKGVKVNDFRLGPLDKLGGGSRIINGIGEADEEQLARLETFASEYVDEEGNLELGLNINQLTSMMEENFSRPTKRRRKIDRALMNGEWPPLLRTLGKTHLDTPYLSIKEVNQMVREKRLPERVLSRLT